MWTAGDRCLAPYSGDGELYEATICCIKKSRKRAEVKFDDYSSDENEIISVSLLKLPGNTDENSTSKVDHSSDSGFVSPLRYMNEGDRLRAKFEQIYEEDSPPPEKKTKILESTSTPKIRRKIPKRKIKSPVVSGGIVKERVAVVSSVHGSKESVGIEVGQLTRADSWRIDDYDSQLEGFTIEELEKPFFPGISDAGPKVPFVLSRPDEEPVIEIPATMNRYLRDYQREGVKFLYHHFRAGCGAILGDDMGLGKTIQVLALLCAILRKRGVQTDCQRQLPKFLQKKSDQPHSSEIFLIVCPNSVLYNWLDEFETWTYCIVGKYHGKDRQETLHKAIKGRLDAVITTYETYRMYMDELLKIQWTAVIVDEVHKIKGITSQITLALSEINTNCRYGLSGTALQNNMGELWCVLNWANPRCLGSWQDFKKKYVTIIGKGQRYDASKRELAHGRNAALKFDKMRKSWLLRRTKAIIADQLPVKDEKVVFCTLTELQTSVYKTLMESEDMSLVLTQHDPCDCGSEAKKGKCCHRYNSEGIKINSLTFTLMSLLIKVANHTALLAPDPKMSELQRRNAAKYSAIAFEKHPHFVELNREARFCTLSDPQYCGKMQILVKLLKMFKRDGSKVLLFSYYTRLLDILEMFLRTTHYTYRRLDGKTPTADRQKLVRDFNHDKDIFLFLISTKAGGMGLNLTGANVVIIFDPNWNPMYDLQAQDRAYRIGQHRDVGVYRLISTGCIEENMYLRQIYKQQLADVAMTSGNAKRYFTAVAGEHGQEGELFGLQNMFSLRTEGSCLTHDLILRERKTEKGITSAKYVPLVMKEDQEEDDSFKNSAFSEECDEGCETSEEDDHGLSSQLQDEEGNGSCDSSDDARTDLRRRRRRRRRNPLMSDVSDDADMEYGSSEDKQESTDVKMKSSNLKRRNLDKVLQVNPRKGNIINNDRDEELREGGDNVKNKNRKKKQISNVISREKQTRNLQDIDEVQVNASRSRVKGQGVARVKGQGAAKGKGKAILRRNGIVENRAKRSAQTEVGEEAGKTLENENPSSSSGDESSVRNHRSGASKDRNRLSSRGTNAEKQIFKECGVSYVHSNMKVIGSSKVEDHVSNIALADVYEHGQFSQQPAFCRVPTLEQNSGSESDDVGPKLSRTISSSKSVDLNVPEPKQEKKRKLVPDKKPLGQTHKMGDTTVFLGQTPPGIRKQQFKELAKKLKVATEEVAKTVMMGTDEECTQLLFKFYQEKFPDADMKAVFFPPEEEHPLKDKRKDALKKNDGNIKNRKEVKGKARRGRKEGGSRSGGKTREVHRRRKARRYQFESSDDEVGEGRDGIRMDQTSDKTGQNLNKTGQNLDKMDKNLNKTGQNLDDSSEKCQNVIIKRVVCDETEFDSLERLEVSFVAKKGKESGRNMADKYGGTTGWDTICTRGRMEEPLSNEDEEEKNSSDVRCRLSEEDVDESDITNHTRGSLKPVSSRISLRKPMGEFDQLGDLNDYDDPGGNLSFLDDIFLSDPSVRLKKPPPKSKKCVQYKCLEDSDF